MPLYDFRCQADHVSQRLAPLGENLTNCDACGAAAQRVPVNRVFVRDGSVLEVDSPATRQKFRLFREASEELAGGPPIDIWSQAKATAAAMTAAGEAPPTLIDTRKEVTHA